MKLIVCDKCGCTSKPIGKAQLMSNGDNIISDCISREWDEVEGYDLCRSCYLSYMERISIRIQKWLGI